MSSLPLNRAIQAQPFRADRWGNKWSQDGLQLQFGNGALTTSIRLGPQALMALTTQLGGVIDRFEDAAGLIWCEDPAAHGACTEARLQWHEWPVADPAAARLAERLFRSIKNLPLTGFERSFKLLAGQLWRDRFLVGLRTAALPAPDLERLAESLGMPAALRAALGARQPEASFVHIGFEHGAGHSTYKLYLEFPRTVALAAACTQVPAPLYLGFKWNPQDSARCTVSSYAQPQSLALADAAQRIAVAYGDSGNSGNASKAGDAGHANGFVSQLAVDIVTQAARASASATVQFVEVTEDNSARLSFDVNLYDSALTVCDLRAPLQALATNFGVPTADFSALMAQTADHLAGHVSGGTDRAGRPFLTLYHAPPAGLAPP